MKSIVVCFISGFTFASGLVFCTDTQPTSESQDKTRPFMRAKLVGSQNVLDGLVTEDFGLIRRGAENMKRISQAVQWPTAKDPVYDHYGVEFRSQCDKLVELADKKNLEGIHFTYLSMTSTCVNCHNYVRGRYRVQEDTSDPRGPVRLIPTEWNGETFKSDRSALLRNPGR